jgi:DNA gyrase subunit A
VNYLAGPGRGVTLIKLASDDRLLGAKLATGPNDALLVKSSNGGEQRVSPAKYELASRGGKGRELMKRGEFTGIVRPPVEAPAPLNEE